MLVCFLIKDVYLMISVLGVFRVRKSLKQDTGLCCEQTARGSKTPECRG